MKTLSALSSAILASSGGAFKAAKRMAYNFAIDTMLENSENQASKEIRRFHDLSIEQRAVIVGSMLKKAFPTLNDYYIIGILANFWDESQICSAIVNGARRPFERAKAGAGSLGLAQFDSIDRYLNVVGQAVKFARKNNLAEFSYLLLHPRVQIDAVISECAGSERDAYQKFVKNSKDAMSATANWQKFYERPANMNPAVRQAYAKKLLAMNLNFDM